MKTTFNYLIPQIFSWPNGYDARIHVPADLIRRRLHGGAGGVKWSGIAYRDGENVQQQSGVVTYGDDAENADISILFKDTQEGADQNQGSSAFLEFTIEAENEDTHFKDKNPPGIYALYTAPGRQSFRTDGAYKFGSPPIIDTISNIGTYIEGYPAVVIDRAQNSGESLFLVNPYTRPILAKVEFSDGRTIPRQRIMPFSSKMIELKQILADEEDSFTGRLQLTANNRVIPFHVRHAFDDQSAIIDHEHLDPFRGNETHLPFTQYLRIRIAKAIKLRRG